MDYNATTSLAFGGVEVVWLAVGAVFIRGGVGGLGLLPVVLKCGTGLRSRP